MNGATQHPAKGMKLDSIICAVHLSSVAHQGAIRVTVTHSLAEVGVHTARVGVLNLRLGAHLWRRDMLHTHVHKACELAKELFADQPEQGADVQLQLLLRQVDAKLI